MQTPDGRWRVEIVRRPGTNTWWYRLIHTHETNEDTTSELDWLTISQVQRILTEAGIDIGTLEEIPQTPAPGSPPAAGAA